MTEAGHWAPEPTLTFDEAWREYHSNHPEVIASYNKTNGYWPNCGCAKCDPEDKMEWKQLPPIVTELDRGPTLVSWAMEEPCDACGAEVNEPCRPGCLGYAIEHDELAGTEPCS